MTTILFLEAVKSNQPSGFWTAFVIGIAAGYLFSQVQRGISKYRKAKKEQERRQPKYFPPHI